MQVLVNLGPTIGEGMLFITVNLIAFLITLILVLRIGSGKIAKPIFLIGLGFLFSALSPMIFGVENIWAVPIIQSIFSAVGILMFIKIFGVWEMIKKK